MNSCITSDYEMEFPSAQDIVKNAFERALSYVDLTGFDSSEEREEKVKPYRGTKDNVKAESDVDVNIDEDYDTEDPEYRPPTPESPKLSRKRKIIPKKEMKESSSDDDFKPSLSKIAKAKPAAGAKKRGGRTAENIFGADDIEGMLDFAFEKVDFNAMAKALENKRSANSYKSHWKGPMMKTLLQAYKK
ncbi:hypothetical protein SAICODRAFT_23737 [Saitoella complicata NRRL Y-17804]|uniref:uncharacterized protein n=1 Tax=Saitoella complicata (strain BCRC 22490 / CBS 7301 / JCM 7358 / NBRC 10748 / NRRL Y-17804) TaxID=698492 RepID=UPI000866A32A|nr:uncharacterized protein SAICODRAFT_23737 [Saitoella complicata NRRL Y-17804]ODQ55054.1 hypothetical protein SAICODRAFT_23737 [Saitoella complicata NRRL Y-17804]